MKKIALSALAGAAVLAAILPAAAALSRYQLRIINNTSSPIVAVYVRNLATDELSGDLLGTGVIQVDGTSVINLTDGTGTCHWRVQTDLADGREVRKTLNVCSTTSLTINN